MKLFIVEVTFSDNDIYCTQTIGIYLDKESAEETKIKWETFFTEKYSEIFSKFSTPEYLDEDGEIKDDFINEYYMNQTKFSSIFIYDSIMIKEFDTDNKLLPIYLETKEYLNILNQWDKEWNRETNLKKILNNVKV